ncbi:isotrichodermin C-15 hydroxylase [Cadophora sp. MPI-SDFR-AT-0126]|nr:isotrichodermin C-15 hydroxylase [Leotiomycetes sp. MPI-SDFR-AT-0126]
MSNLFKLSYVDCALDPDHLATGLRIGLTIACFSQYCTCVIVHRIYIHPLSRYPGPELAKISSLYSIYHAWRGDRHLDLLRLHGKYGSVVRYGPNSLSFNSPHAVSAIYTHDKNIAKTSFYNFFDLNKTTKHTQSIIDKHSHGRRRRIISHALSEKVLRGMEVRIICHVQKLCNALGHGSSPVSNVWSDTKDMSLWTLYYAIDTITDLCFGYCASTIDSPINRDIAKLIETSSQKALICGLLPVIKILGLDQILYPLPSSSGGKSFIIHNQKILAQRLKSEINAADKDILSYLINAKQDQDNGSLFLSSELWAENLSVSPGSETISVALSATLFYIVHNDDSHQVLNAEVRTTFNATNQIRLGQRLESCEYLRACINEAMRLAPPVPGILPREVECDGVYIDGFPVPKGTEVGVSAYAIHHNASYYPEPFLYNPTRWIRSKDSQSDGIDLAHFAFCPFSAGTRGCLGKSLAYAELSLALARIVFVYDMRVEPDQFRIQSPAEERDFGRHKTMEYKLRDAYIGMKCGPNIQFKSRMIDDHDSGDQQLH